MDRIPSFFEVTWQPIGEKCGVSLKSAIVVGNSTFLRVPAGEPICLDQVDTGFGKTSIPGVITRGMLIRMQDIDTGTDPHVTGKAGRHQVSLYVRR